MQTPQGGRRSALLDAHALAAKLYTDEMALLEAAGYGVKIVDGSATNFKITTVEDLERARQSVGTESRTGIGYDVHKFSADPTRPLYLGGVRFDGSPGLEGHSDADVVIHAAVDAMLGAAALGDIGTHFPDTDPAWKDADSMDLLAQARVVVEGRGWRVTQADVTIITEAPRLAAFLPAIAAALAGALGVGRDDIGVKAKTNEGMGFIGRGEGLAVIAVATLEAR